MGRKYLMKYIKDEYNKDLLFDENSKYQTMMQWEKPYMNAIIENLSPSGDVLEIGFGLGYSANKIQSFNIKSHTIIENDPIVFQVLKDWSLKQKNKVNIIFGDWQKIVPNLKEKYDSIFFDDAPTNKYNDLEQVRFFLFYYYVFLNNVKINTKLSWYLDYPIYWITHPDTNFDIKKINIEIPENANYVPEFSKKNKTLYMPLITFKNGTTTDILPLFLTKDFRVGFF
jgi:hypothetical protein